MAMARFGKSKHWQPRACLCCLIAESARLMDYKEVRTVTLVAPSSSAAMEAGKSWRPKEVGTCNQGIECGSKPQVAVVLEMNNFELDCMPDVINPTGKNLTNSKR